MEDSQHIKQSTSTDESQQVPVNPKALRRGNPPPKHPIEYWEERLLGKRLYRDDKEIPPEETDTAVREIDIPVPTRKLPGATDYMRKHER
ncbi:unnamed protein product [Penicillium pancosmium]